MSELRINLEKIQDIFWNILRINVEWRGQGVG
jgi:hypothetical protein